MNWKMLSVHRKTLLITAFPPVWPKTATRVSVLCLPSTQASETLAPKLIVQSTKKLLASERLNSHLPKRKAILGVVFRSVWLHIECISQASLNSMSSWKLAWPGGAG
jgi:hypothetical protein